MADNIIRQSVVINAAPGVVYRALVESKRHAAFTGARAILSRKVGGSFTCYDGYITGRNLELVPSKRIVQAWRAKGWPAGVYSVASFALSGAAGGKTKITFTHVGVPPRNFKGITEGWRTHYWRPLRAYLEA
jgi:activator of HSP90 ATPase